MVFNKGFGSLNQLGRLIMGAPCRGENYLKCARLFLSACANLGTDRRRRRRHAQSSGRFCCEAPGVRQYVCVSVCVRNCPASSPLPDGSRHCLAPKRRRTRTIIARSARTACARRLAYLHVVAWLGGVSDDGGRSNKPWVAARTTPSPFFVCQSVFIQPPNAEPSVIIAASLCIETSFARVVVGVEARPV